MDYELKTRASIAKDIHQLLKLFIMSETKESLSFTDFLRDNQNIVPAKIVFKKSNKDFLFFHQAFSGLEIIAIHLLKKDEWIYGLYSGCTRVGFFYDGSTLSIDQQIKCLNEYIPQDANELHLFVRRFCGKIDYHKCTNDAYKIIGELDEHEIIQQIKRK